MCNLNQNQPAVPSRMYSFVRARQLEGSYPGDHTTGVFVQTAMRIARGWGTPDEKQWPYDASGNWPPTEPKGIDGAAKRHRISAYQRVRTLDECKLALAQGATVNISVSIAMTDWRHPPKGRIPMPANDTDLSVTHSILVMGYDNGANDLIIQNSWGANWGEGGYGYLPQRYFDRYQHEAWVIPPEALVLQPFSGDGILSRAWSFPDLLAETPFLGIEIYDGSNNECAGWSFIVRRQAYADIEEFFVRPMFRGAGLGSKSAELILQRPEFEDCPLRLWIGHPDRRNVKSSVARTLAKRLKLTINPSKRRWASYVAM